MVPVAPAFEALFSPGVVYQDAAHRLGSGGEEVTAAIPAIGLLASDEPDVSLVDEGGSLEGVAGGFGGHPGGSQLAQFVVDEREQFFGGTGVGCNSNGPCY